MLVPMIVDIRQNLTFEWNRVRTKLGCGGRASFVSMSSTIMLAMRTTRCSVAHSAYSVGRILRAVVAELVRLGATSLLLLAADQSIPRDCLLLMLGGSNHGVGLVGGEGTIVGTKTIGLGDSF